MNGVFSPIFENKNAAMATANIHNGCRLRSMFSLNSQIPFNEGLLMSEHIWY